MNFQNRQSMRNSLKPIKFNTLQASMYSLKQGSSPEAMQALTKLSHLSRKGTTRRKSLTSWEKLDEAFNSKTGKRNESFDPTNVSNFDKSYYRGSQIECPFGDVDQISDNGIPGAVFFVTSSAFIVTFQ
uniref:Uncharacterized protein n=1 Tax=Romanomermis culicivorax TaxID=13658 RepID=A0A915J474_ROMCU